MPDWTKSMKQTFEYYKVDPNTWHDEEIIDTIIESRIDRDSGAETLGSASFTTTEIIGECYIRIYLITIQNGIRERFPLGTFLIQTPSYSFDGKIKNVSVDAYTPLIELKEKQPPIGFFTPKDRNVLEESKRLIEDNLRAPVVKTTSSDTIPYDFVSNVNDTWMTYIKDLINLSNYYISLDEMGRVLFKPKQLKGALKPIWIYNDDNSSILYPSISLENDLYGIPNVVEVIYSTDEYYFYERIENKEDDSPISIQNRGREIIHRATNPEIEGIPNKDKIRRYAERLLDELSSIEYTITYTHGYCPTEIGDCVLLNYKSAGINNIRATIISQSISCIPGAPVEEKAVFTDNLWR